MPQSARSETVGETAATSPSATVSAAVSEEVIVQPAGRGQTNGPPCTTALPLTTVRLPDRAARRCRTTPIRRSRSRAPATVRCRGSTGNSKWLPTNVGCPAPASACRNVA